MYSRVVAAVHVRLRLYRFAVGRSHSHNSLFHPSKTHPPQHLHPAFPLSTSPTPRTPHRTPIYAHTHRHPSTTTVPPIDERHLFVSSGQVRRERGVDADFMRWFIRPQPPTRWNPGSTDCNCGWPVGMGTHCSPLTSSSQVSGNCCSADKDG